MGCGCLKKQNVKIIASSFEEIKKENTNLEGQKKEEEEDRQEMENEYKKIQPVAKYESSSNLGDSDIQRGISKDKKDIICHLDEKNDKMIENDENQIENMKTNKKNQKPNFFSSNNINVIKLSNKSLKLENKIISYNEQRKSTQF